MQNTYHIYIFMQILYKQLTKAYTCVLLVPVYQCQTRDNSSFVVQKTINIYCCLENSLLIARETILLLNDNSTMQFMTFYQYKSKGDLMQFTHELYKEVLFNKPCVNSIQREIGLKKKKISRFVIDTALACIVLPFLKRTLHNGYFIDGRTMTYCST